MVVCPSRGKTECMNFSDGTRCYVPPEFCWRVDPASGSTDLVGSRLLLWTQAALKADTYTDAVITSHKNRKRGIFCGVLLSTRVLPHGYDCHPLHHPRTPLLTALLTINTLLTIRRTVDRKRQRGDEELHQRRDGDVIDGSAQSARDDSSGK